MSLLAGALTADAVTDVRDDAPGLRDAAQQFAAAADGVLDDATRASRSWGGLPRVLAADAVTAALVPLMEPAVQRASALHAAGDAFVAVANRAADAIEDLSREHDALVAQVDRFHASAPGRVADHVAKQAASGDVLGAAATVLTSWRQVPALVAEEADLRWRVQAHDDRVTGTMTTIAAQIGAITPTDSGPETTLATPAASVFVRPDSGNWFADVLHGAESVGDTAWDGIRAGAEAAWPSVQDAAATVGNIGASIGNAVAEHPDEVGTLIGGLLLMAAGGAVEGGGVVLDITGVGAIVGVPANVAGAAMMVTGAGAATVGGGALAAHAATDDSSTPYRSDHAKEAHDEYAGRSKDGTYRAKGNGEARNDSARKEAQGLEDYEEETGQAPVSREVTARVDGTTAGRRYDGLAEKPDGTYEGVEVKSGSARLTKQQADFDSRVSYDNPATAVLNGQRITITSVRRVNVR